MICKLLAVTWGIFFPDQGSKLGRAGVLATGSQGEVPYEYIFKTLHVIQVHTEVERGLGGYYA